METLLIVVIALAGVLGIVIVVSVSSILFVQSKYSALKSSHKKDEEAPEQNTNVSTYVQHSVYTVKPPKVDDVSAYQKLEELLLRDPGGTTQMTEAFHPHAMDEVAQALVVLFEANDVADVLIRNFIDLEMTKASEGEGPTTLFRRDSVASKVMRFYSKLIGQQYLISVLWPNIRYVCLSDELFEIDQNRMPKEDSLEDHLTKFEDLLANFLEAIVNSIPLCPPQLRAICHHLNSKANQFFPDNDLKVVSGFIFLRFFTPAIICPNAYGIIEGDLTPNQSRTLLLVAKVLQNMANGILFGAKEQYMMPMNEFLTINTSLVKGFLADLAQPDPHSTCTKAFSISTDSKFTALRVLHANILRSFPKFKRDNYPFLYDKTQKLLRELDGDKRVNSRPNTVNSMRRVSVSFLRVDSSSTPSTPSSAEPINLQAIEITSHSSLPSSFLLTPSALPHPSSSLPFPIPSSPLSLPSSSHHIPIRASSSLHETEIPKKEKASEEKKSESQESRNGAGREERESEGESEEEDYEETEKEGKGKEIYENKQMANSATSLISPSTVTSPPDQITKSKSGTELHKSKSGNTPKKKKNRNIPNERLYRPSSTPAKLTSTSPLSPHFSSFILSPSPPPSPPSPSAPRSTSPMKTPLRTSPSPKLPRAFSPRPASLGGHPK